jgi:hypothetical protein
MGGEEGGEERIGRAKAERLTTRRGGGETEEMYTCQKQY